MSENTNWLSTRLKQLLGRNFFPRAAKTNPSQLTGRHAKLILTCFICSHLGQIPLQHKVAIPKKQGHLIYGTFLEVLMLGQTMSRCQFSF